MIIWRYSSDVVNIALKRFTCGGESYWFMRREAANVASEYSRCKNLTVTPQVIHYPIKIFVSASCSDPLIVFISIHMAYVRLCHLSDQYSSG